MAKKEKLYFEYREKVAQLEEEISIYKELLKYKNDTIKKLWKLAELLASKSQK